MSAHDEAEALIRKADDNAMRGEGDDYVREQREALIEEVRRLNAAATPGPWTHTERGRVFVPQHLITEGYVVYPGGNDPDDETPETLAAEALTERNGELIARYRTLAPQLADALEATLYNARTFEEAARVSDVLRGEVEAALREERLARAKAAEIELLRTAALAHDAEIDCALAEVARLKAALVAAAEHHEEQADLWNSDNEFGDDETGEYHAERAAIYRAAAEGKP